MKKLKKQLKQLQQAYRDLDFERGFLEDKNAAYKRLNDNLAISEANSIEHIIDLNNDLKVQEKMNAHLETILQSAESALIYKEDLYDKALHAIGVLTIRAGVE